MLTTINISIPKKMLEDAKKVSKLRGFTSVDELVKDSLKKTVYNEDDKNAITENGFPVWFEDKVLESEASSTENDIIIDTDEDLKKYFKDLHERVEKRRHGQS